MANQQSFKERLLAKHRQLAGEKTAPPAVTVVKDPVDVTVEETEPEPPPPPPAEQARAKPGRKPKTAATPAAAVETAVQARSYVELEDVARVLEALHGVPKERAVWALQTALSLRERSS